MLNNGDRYREIENRERLVQTFLIISGFLLAYISNNITGFALKSFYTTFWFFLVFIIFYYITITRTQEFNNVVDYMAMSSSILFSFLIIYFLELQTNIFFSWISFIPMYFSLIFITTFSLISPSTSEKYFDKFIQTDINLK